MRPLFQISSFLTLENINVRICLSTSSRVPMLLAALVAACGGDTGEACSATPGVFPVTYEPGTSNGAGYSQLFYVKDSEQTWNLAFHGTTAACSSSLSVRAQTPLPAGYTVDATTGTIRREKSATGQSGYCTEAGQVRSLWNEGTCPAGQVPVVSGYFIEITSANDPPYTLGVSFAPAGQ